MELLILVDEVAHSFRGNNSLLINIINDLHWQLVILKCLLETLEVKVLEAIIK